MTSLTWWREIGKLLKCYGGPSLSHSGWAWSVEIFNTHFKFLLHQCGYIWKCCARSWVPARLAFSDSSRFLVRILLLIIYVALHFLRVITHENSRNAVNLAHVCTVQCVLTHASLSTLLHGFIAGQQQKRSAGVRLESL